MRWKPQLGKVGVVILVCAHASCWKQAQEDSKATGWGGAVCGVLLCAVWAARGLPDPQLGGGCRSCLHQATAKLISMLPQP